MSRTGEVNPPEELLRQHQLLMRLPLARELLDVMPSFVLVLNRQRQTVFANQRLLEFLGNPQLSELLGQRPGDLWDCRHAIAEGAVCGTTPYCDYCGAVSAISKAKDGKPSTTAWSITAGHGGKRHDLSISSAGFVWSEEPFTLLAITDASDERRRLALEHIFFHDVLNTAGTISGAAHLLSKADEQRVPELQSMICRASRRLIDEITAQRDLLSAETGELEPQWARIHGQTLLRELADVYSAHPVASERNITLSALDPALCFTSDWGMLWRVLGNLLKNALEACEPDQTVTLGAEQLPDGDIRLEVHNPGVMPVAVQMQIFDRSFSTKGKGRGLGTYGIKLLVERYLGGQVSFSSRQSEGTTFRVALPRVPPLTGS